jgi:hypothetical protein
MTTAAVTKQLSDARSNDVTLDITISGGAGGGALSALAINRHEVFGMKLDEVEVVGADANGLTIVNSYGTTIFSLDPIVAGIYGGHVLWGIFPKKDANWTIATDGFTASGVVVVRLKFTRFNG